MPKKKGSTDALASFGLKRGSRKQKKGESRFKFMKRLAGPKARQAMVAAQGSIMVFAQAYGIEHRDIRDMIACGKVVDDEGTVDFEPLFKARQEGQIVRRGLEIANQQVQEAVLGKMAAEKAGDEPSRQRWPTDPKKRDEAVKAYLLGALVEHEGRKALVADGGSLTLSSVLAMIQRDPELQAAERRGLDCAAVRIEEQYLDNAQASGSHAAQASALKSLNADRYGDKRQVEVTGGFSMPDEAEELPSALGVLKVVGDSDHQEN